MNQIPRPNDYRTPRTLHQAFGPYAQLHTTERAPSAGEISFAVVGVLFLCGVAAFAAIQMTA